MEEGLAIWRELGSERGIAGALGCLAILVKDQGDPIRARIIKIDTGDKKIGLSTRDVAPLTAEESAQVTGTPKEEEQAQEQPAETPQD